jgi:hypothetical protein
VVQPAEDEAAPVAEGGGPAPATPARPPTPEEDSIRDAASYRRRLRSMESYESCMAKIADIEEPARTTLRNACARTRAVRP